MEGRGSFPAIWQAILLSLLLMLLLVLCGAAAQALLESLGIGPNTLATLAIGNTLAFLLVLPPAVILAGRPLGETFPFRRAPAEIWLPLSLVVIGWNIVASELDNLLRMVLPAPEWLEDVLRELLSGDRNLLLQVLVLVVIAPWTEELFFRGLILQGFLRRYSLPTAVWVSALLFALFHGNPWQFPSALVIGGFLAWWCARTGSLWPGLYGHALNNGLPMVVVPLGLEIPGYTLPGPEAGHQPLWFDALGLALAISGLIWVARKLPSGLRETPER